ncbi:MAG: ferredoxin-type protein NapF [Candidatus Sedimenticola endophacoides]|nr:MAG: ferredoxin-type protein NapF [Candidatus Sedimenticola endophacoides]OQX32865.1 MAG: ferredoxin-type protein NapF [Candidatus Sedimenticola endophacoides]OQX42643.1 MAG: ferredoxin-type protein NapF [Candidatus Sedimenticola endophacoides]
MNRARFLRGQFGGGAPLPRPPWALPETEFTDRCTRCDNCIGVCPDQLLVRGGGGFPVIDFSRGGCDFCGECSAVCEPGVLARGDGERPPWALVARIGGSCLAVNAVTCRCCGEVCAPRAIRFRLQTGGRAIPELDQQACTGCGACHAVCPVRAVEISALTDEWGEMTA